MKRSIQHIPESVRVPRGTIVQWEINPPPLGYAYRRRPPLEFQVYFPKKSPFEWNIFNKEITGFSPLIIPKRIILAEGVAGTLGDYKYGIQVLEKDSDRILDDEDPYLIIF